MFQYHVTMFNTLAKIETLGRFSAIQACLQKHHIDSETLSQADTVSASGLTAYQKAKLSHWQCNLKMTSYSFTSGPLLGSKADWPIAMEHLSVGVGRIGSTSIVQHCQAAAVLCQANKMCMSICLSITNADVHMLCTAWHQLESCKWDLVALVQLPCSTFDNVEAKSISSWRCATQISL